MNRDVFDRAYDYAVQTYKGDWPVEGRGDCWWLCNTPKGFIIHRDKDSFGQYLTDMIEDFERNEMIKEALIAIGEMDEDN